MKKAGCPVNQVIHNGKCVHAITGYHITDIDSWNKIKKQGMSPGTQKGPFQCYDPHWTGTYIFSEKRIAELNQDRMIENMEGTEYAHKKYFPIIEVKIPDIKESHVRMRPDEDWSEKPADWKRWKDEGSACILGKIPPKYLKKVG